MTCNELITYMLLPMRAKLEHDVFGAVRLDDGVAAARMTAASFLIKLPWPRLPYPLEDGRPKNAERA